MKKEAHVADCDSCIHHLYDEELLAYYCDLLLDEDEILRCSFAPQRRCPFYQFNDEYINVRKQI